MVKHCGSRKGKKRYVQRTRRNRKIRGGDPSINEVLMNHIKNNELQQAKDLIDTIDKTKLAFIEMLVKGDMEEILGNYKRCIFKLNINMDKSFEEATASTLLGKEWCKQ